MISPIPQGSFQSKHIDAASFPEQLKALLLSDNFLFDSIQQASQSSYIVLLKSGEKVYFTPKKDIVEQVHSLQLIQSRLTIEGKDFSQLDLRFDQPVIVFK